MLFNRKTILKLLILPALAALLYVYKTYNPAEAGFFPKCPFRYLTGYLCPGCGSQRCVHHLLNGDVHAAYHQNALLVLFLPYIIFGFITDYAKATPFFLKVRKYLYGYYAIIIVAVIVVSFWIFRNL